MRLFIGIEVFFTILLKDHGLKTRVGWRVAANIIVIDAHIPIIIWLNHGQLNPQEVICSLCNFGMGWNITATNDTINGAFVNVSFILDLSLVLHLNLGFQFCTDTLVRFAGLLFQNLN